MKTSSFKKVIRLQFNALMMITMKGTLKQKRKLLARHFKQEVLFCEMGETRAFILLYYFHDMSDKEIAKPYHVSRSAVGYTRNKGLEKLKMMLSEKEIL